MLITLIDNTDRPSMLCAVLRCPVGLDADASRAAVDAAFNSVCQEHPEDDWSYTDLIELLEKSGFENQPFVEWREI